MGHKGPAGVCKASCCAQLFSVLAGWRFPPWRGTPGWVWGWSGIMGGGTEIACSNSPCSKSARRPLAARRGNGSGGLLLPKALHLKVLTGL